ncbi:alpha/beta hydrolase [Corynebacterium lizhenjunii]|uniref:alpha/beta hydrolase n=1 Tax=Corynebacterium lizhenjunii TaxID=2709394 RepID=UPI001F3BD8FE|nr:alpha/beta hydrolase [Corynebacterium lizhenjunii]
MIRAGVDPGPGTGVGAAASLRGAAAQLRLAAGDLEEFIGDSHRLWVRLFADLEGPAATAGRAALEDTAGRMGSTAGSIAAAAEVLERYAVLYAQLHRAAALGQVSAIAETLATVGAAVDWMCARELELLCTPIPPPPPQRLEDFDDLPLASIDAIQRATAPPDIRLFLEANPDLIVLEASPGRLVAVVDGGIGKLRHSGTAPATVTTFVPGVGSSEASNWNGQIERARKLAQATGGPAVAWMGYTAPSSVPRAIQTAPAEAGGAELARFQAAMRRRWPNTRQIVVGYSYGSVVAGHAASRGMRADDVVLVGSPGAGVPDARAFGGRVWTATNRGDPIALVPGARGGPHGPDPRSRSFGARSAPGAGRRPGDHGSYWQDTAFVDAVGSIARGRCVPGDRGPV